MIKKNLGLLRLYVLFLFEAIMEDDDKAFRSSLDELNALAIEVLPEK